MKSTDMGHKDTLISPSGAPALTSQLHLCQIATYYQTPAACPCLSLLKLVHVFCIVFRSNRAEAVLSDTRGACVHTQEALCYTKA